VIIVKCLRSYNCESQSKELCSINRWSDMSITKNFVSGLYELGRLAVVVVPCDAFYHTATLATTNSD